MRILTSKQFELEPVGTVYCLWTPAIFTDNVHIKGSKRGSEQSWWDLSLLPWGKDEDEKYNLNTEIETEEFCTDNATYNYNDKQLWCVFNQEEVKGMIKRLQNALIGIVDED